jgi:hypothetical protein
MLFVLSLAAAAMLYYNWRVAGGPFLLPYAANRAKYAVANVFVWQTANPIPKYHHRVMRDFYLGWELNTFNLSRGWKGFEAGVYEKIFKTWMFFVGPVFIIALTPFWRVVTDRRIRLLVIIAGVSAVILSVSVYFNPHYVAAETALIYAVMLQGLRHVRAWRIRRKPIGVALSRALPVICLVIVGFRAAAGPLKLPLILSVPTWCSQFTPDNHREDLITRLKSMGGRHLVIVRYAPVHQHWYEDWVYNDADIDSSPIVWAREMDAPRNAELIRYFHNRHIWLLEPDRDTLKLTDYTQ